MELNRYILQKLIKLENDHLRFCYKFKYQVQHEWVSDSNTFFHRNVC